MDVKAVILAGGKGKRMKSDMPKVLSTICGESLINHVVLNAKNAGISDISIVTGYKSETVRANTGEGPEYLLQEEQLGTAHAVNCARSFFEHDDCAVIVLCGDAPLVNSDTISALIAYFEGNDADIAVLTAELDDAANYGRIIRDAQGCFEKIVERKDASMEEAAVKEVNSGTIIFRSSVLSRALDTIMASGAQNAQGEYYLTDAISITKNNGGRVMAFKAEDSNVVLGANDRYELYLCEKAMRKAINKEHMLNGVRIIDSDNTYIDRQAVIGSGTVIYPGTIITGKTVIGNDNLIYTSRIDDSVIADSNTIDNSVIESSEIGNGNLIGPYAHLRKDTRLSDRTKVGSFSETKNASIGEGTKVPHLCYVGDSEVGKGVNFGCGSVTANYDGVAKHKTVIGDNAFIGCNVNMVAPISIGNDTFIAAGSTVSRDIPDKTFVIERSKRIEHEARILKK